LKEEENGSEVAEALAGPFCSKVSSDLCHELCEGSPVLSCKLVPTLQRQEDPGLQENPHQIQQLGVPAMVAQDHLHRRPALRHPCSVLVFINGDVICVQAGEQFAFTLLEVGLALSLSLLFCMQCGSKNQWLGREHPSPSPFYFARNAGQRISG